MTQMSDSYRQRALALEINTHVTSLDLGGVGGKNGCPYKVDATFLVRFGGELAMPRLACDRIELQGGTWASPDDLEAIGQGLTWLALRVAGRRNGCPYKEDPALLVGIRGDLEVPCLAGRRVQFHGHKLIFDNDLEAVGQTLPPPCVLRAWLLSDHSYRCHETNSSQNSSISF